MIRIITVQRHERVAVLRNGAYVRLLGPGRHTVWSVGLVELVRYDLHRVVELVPDLDPLPRGAPGTRIVRVEPGQRLVVRVAGEVREALDPGRYRVWTEVPDVELTWHDAHARPQPLADDDRLEPRGAGWVEIAVSDSIAVILYRDGHPVQSLPHGRYRVWDDSPWSVRALSLAMEPLEVAAQDLLTADQVPVRIKVAAATRVVDPVRRVVEHQAPAHAYGAVQLALREVVAARELDELVSDRDALSSDLLERARAVLPEVGLAIEVLHVKDVILSADVKELVNRVTLARKEAEAHAIKRREEVAATRQLANTAKLLERSPVLLRLKELEALGELVPRIDKLVVVGAGDLAQRLTLRELE